MLAGSVDMVKRDKTASGRNNEADTPMLRPATPDIFQQIRRTSRAAAKMDYPHTETHTRVTNPHINPDKGTGLTSAALVAAQTASAPAPSAG